MRGILQQRPLRWVFTANVVSMLGSGMNAAAVTWYVLQATHSEMALGYLVALQTIPAMLMLPFTGVLIDREDRRRLVMLLDAGRGAVILLVAVLALRHQVHLWELYLMNILVAAGFWMFWPTITALIQELTPEEQFVQSNTFLLAGVQGGWLIAGSVVGFAYNHIGLGGVLLIDFSTYVVSFLCYFAVRKGRQVVAKPKHDLRQDVVQAETAVARYLGEMREGIRWVGEHRYVILLGTSWALFLGAMLTQGVVTAPYSDRVLHAGAVGYGWLNMGWGMGAFVSVIYSPGVIGLWGGRRSVAISMALLALCIFLSPFVGIVFVAVAIYFVMGSARGVGGVAISSGMMEMVPKHFMGRVQNTFYFAGTVLQVMTGLLAGVVAHRLGLAWAFAMIGTLYVCAFLTAAWPVTVAAKAEAATVE